MPGRRRRRFSSWWRMSYSLDAVAVLYVYFLSSLLLGFGWVMVL